MRNTLVLGLILILVILAPGIFFILGNQPPFPIENTESIKVMTSLSVIETNFPQKASEIKQIINEASLIEKELREQNTLVRFFVGVPIEKVRRLSQLFNETEEKLADIFGLAYGVENTGEIHAATKEIRNEMLQVWVLSLDFEKNRGIFGFLN